MIRAHEKRASARMGFGRGRFESGAFNRRFIMSNGRSRMHGGGGYETIITRFGPGAGETIRDTSCELIETLIVGKGHRSLNTIALSPLKRKGT